MTDIDAELLALAGDASSDEEDAPMNISGATSMSPDSKQFDGSAKPGKKNGGRNGRRSDRNESEEEGEASSGPGSPDSLQSAPMDESDSDSDTSPANVLEEEDGQDGDKYPIEGKYRSAADKANIQAMPEIKREEILAQRAAEVERDRQNEKLRQFIRARNTETKKQDKKRKAGAADLEEGQRKTSRQRTKLGGGKFGETNSGIDSLKRARAEKDDRQRKRREDNERNRERRKVVAEGYSDHDAPGESDNDWEGNKKKARSPSADFQDAQPAAFQDIQHARISRSLLAKVCFYPGFEEAMTGCYVRVSVGHDQETGQNVYRMALIKGFVEGKPYAMDGPSGKPFMTTQYVRAAHGKSERVWPFIMCSDSPFTEAEWIRFQKFCLGEGVPIPTKPKLLNKIEDIGALINRRWTNQEITEKLQRAGLAKRLEQSLDIRRFTKELKEAEYAEDEERVEELKAKLNALANPKLAFNTSLTKPPSQRTSESGMNHKAQQERIAKLNLENRRKNVEQVRQALINERRAARRNEAALARGEVVNEDHTKRVEHRVKFKYNVSSETGPKEKGVEESGVSGSTVDTSKPASATPTYQIKAGDGTNSNGVKGLPGLRRPLQDDDIIGSIDLDIDLEL